MEKKELRRSALQVRNSLNQAERHKKDARIRNNLESLPIFQQSQNILLYFSVKSEVGTVEIMRKWIREKQLLLPLLISTESFLPLPISSLESLKINHIGIPEPPEPESGSFPEPKIDLIIIPGIAFDRKGNRIGMGKGYYDRFLRAHKGVPRIALAYSEQILDHIAHKPYDEPVDMIITESEIIRCKVSP